MHKIDQQLFKKGSITYYYSSKFFPKDIRDDVFKLYSFLRFVDDLIDKPKPDIAKFNKVKARWETIKLELAKGNVPNKLDESILEHVLWNISFICHRYTVDVKYVDAFLKSMTMDVNVHKYETFKETLDYVYGSAEIVGIFMAAIMKLPEKAVKFARLQGRAMQYINFIRDIAEDNELGRCYFANSELRKYGLKNITPEEAMAKPNMFKDFVQSQIRRYREWQMEADYGYKFIPKSVLVALKTANDGYAWTAEQIYENPMSVYSVKHKPNKIDVLKMGAKNVFSAGLKPINIEEVDKQDEE